MKRLILVSILVCSVKCFGASGGLSGSPLSGGGSGNGTGTATNVAYQVMTNFVLNTVYTNISGGPMLISSLARVHTAAVNGDASIDLMVDQAGGITFIPFAGIRMGTIVAVTLSMDYTNSVSTTISNLASYYWTNSSIGAGNVGALIAGTASYTALGAVTNFVSAGSGTSGTNINVTGGTVNLVATPAFNAKSITNIMGTNIASFGLNSLYLGVPDTTLLVPGVVDPTSLPAAVAIGAPKAFANTNSVSIGGENTQVTGVNSVGLGFNVVVSGNNSIGIGANTDANYDYEIVIGRDAGQGPTATNIIEIGNSVAAQKDNQAIIGSSGALHTDEMRLRAYNLISEGFSNLLSQVSISNRVAAGQVTILLTNGGAYFPSNVAVGQGLSVAGGTGSNLGGSNFVTLLVITNFATVSNLLTIAAQPDFRQVTPLFVTNASFVWATPTGLDSAGNDVNYTTITVTNNSNAAIVMTGPANYNPIGTNSVNAGGVNEVRFKRIGNCISNWYSLQDR